MKQLTAGLLLLTTFVSGECVLAQDFDAFEYRNVGPSRGGRVTAVADMAYPQPMLTGQIDYLFNMINTADQAPGKEAEDRFEVLALQLLEVTVAAAE
jgi:hypothetical protein